MKNQIVSSSEVTEANRLNLLINYLTDKLNVSLNSLAIAQKCYHQDFPHQLPIILWQYGIIRLEELNEFFDWWESL